MFNRKKGAKYNSSKVEIDGIKFDSKKEAKRYQELRQMELGGVINDLRLQVPFVLVPNQRKKDGSLERSVKYIADFVYEVDGEEVVEDVKGFKLSTAYSVFVIKRKLMLEKYGIEVIEI